MQSHSVEITLDNIENYRGDLKIRTDDLPFELWSVFDLAMFAANPCSRIVPLSQVVSRKSEILDEKYVSGEKADPRATAFKFMLEASTGQRPKRAPILVRETSPARFEVIDGNATAQVLMLASWPEVPVIIRQA